MAVKSAVLNLTKNLSNLVIHIQMHNKVTLFYLLQLGDTHSLELLKIRLNVQAGSGFWKLRDSSNSKLHQSMFRSIFKHFGYPTVDLFTSRMCYQLPQYIALKPYSNIIATDAMQQCWNKMFPYAFLVFSLLSRILKNDCQEKAGQVIIVTPKWQTQTWFPLLLEISMQYPLLFTPFPDLM